MRGLVVFLLIVAIFLSFIFLNINIKEDENAKNNFGFSTFTSAICEDKNDFVYCKDELFVNCNGKISKAIDVVECNGIKMNAPKVTGFAVFEKDWKDPRQLQSQLAP